MKTVVTLIPLLPLAGFAITLLLGKRFGKRPDVVPLVMVTASWLLSMYVVAHVLGHREEALNVDLFTWVAAGTVEVQWGYYVDTLTAVMLLVVSTIGMLVHYYSIGYMHGDGGYYRFFAYLNLFMFSMFVLILANNYLLVFLGWEAVGLCSYLLIAFWFHKKSASQAGKKAFLVNRVGDFGFTLGIFLIFTTFGTLQFTGVLSPGAAEGVGGTTMTAICLLLFMGAMGKSAQFPLHVWLPDAMEGPTPVSALIHAATMVNAGVYMVARLVSALHPLRDGDAGRDDHRHDHRHLRRADRPHADRHQARDRLLHPVVAGLHVHGPRRRRLGGRHLLPARARLLQGSAVPRLGLGHPRHVGRTGHAPDGRLAQEAAGHLLDDADRRPGHGRHPAARGLLGQGRDHRRRLRRGLLRRLGRSASWWPS